MHDSHIHMALSPLKENYQSDIQDFIDQNGKKILVQSTDVLDFTETIQIVESINAIYPGIADLALGIHPTIFSEALERDSLEDLEIFKYAQKQMTLFRDIFKKNISNVKAVGETGLDYYDMNTYSKFSTQEKEVLLEIQKKSFRMQTQLAKEHNLPLSIHSRDVSGSTQCTKDVLEILAQEGKGTLRGCFHSYTGELEMVEEILNLGFHIGFNAIVTYPSGENVREILKATPLERILFETDGPFLPTQKVRKDKKEEKRYGRPVSVREIMEYASDVKGIPISTLEEVTDENYFILFGK